MNGFILIAESYKKLMNEGKIDTETAEKEIRIYEFLATCDIDDLCRLVDSGVFNDFIKAYLEKMLDVAELGSREKIRAKEELNWLFDSMSASEVAKKYGYL